MATEKTYNEIKFFVAEDYEEMSGLAAKIILERVKEKPSMNILTPAGNTPKGVYQILRDHPDLLEDISLFMPDEYLTDDKINLISESHQASFRQYRREQILKHMNIRASYHPNSPENPELYDKLINELEGIDFCLNAIGIDGHTFGFNFPGSPNNSLTRIVEIPEEIKRENQEKYGHATPKYALTMGLTTGMKSKEIVTIVSGEKNAQILYDIIKETEFNPNIPATILRQHHNHQWIIDKKAAMILDKMYN